MKIPLKVKIQCVKLFEDGLKIRKIYDDYFTKEHEGMSYRTFRRQLLTWRNKKFADEHILAAGTYEGFIAHDATVQVGANGLITQAWIKQSAEDVNWNEIVKSIQAATQVCPLEICESDEATGMLEIPLFDMHFGVSRFEDYATTQAELANIIRRKRWQEIVFVVGQDLIHNNDMRGHTAKGTQIAKVDIPLAWADAQRFYFPMIELAIKSSNRVSIRYSKGNHDECISWCFMQLLKERYPKISIDDSFNKRKCIYWQGCFIGICHGNESRSKVNDLRGQFTIDFPVEFGEATVREIHAGHLHHEIIGDLYGVMVRRLSSGAPTDEWSDEEGYIGAHKRFQIFEFEPNKLKAIHYI